MRTMRRTQAERSETTKRKLIEATVRCLIRDGYNGLTTPKICADAGVSRGAMQHQFPSRSDLVRATIEHVFRERLLFFRETYRSEQSAPPEGSAPTEGSLLTSLVDAAAAPEGFVPWLELTVAGRTDPEIREAIASVTQQMRAETLRVAGELGFTQWSRVAWALTFVDGLAIQELAAPDPTRRRAVLEVMEEAMASLLEEPK